ncbi:MAG: hypothetical protein Q9181_006934 [Wetmoreana brouardii]
MPEAPAPEGHHYQGSVNAHGQSNLHAGDVLGDVTNNYEQKKNNPFNNLSKAETGPKLHDFACGGEKSRLEKLLELDVELEWRGPKGNTALHRALEFKHTECAKLLIKAGADVNAHGEQGRTPLFWSVSHDDSEMVAYLLKEENAHADVKIEGMTVLATASRDRHCDTVEVLLAHGVDINAADANGWTALMFAADRGHEFVVRQLLAFGRRPDLEAKTRLGWTALIQSAEHGHHDIVDQLLVAGANVHAETVDGWTALMVAAGRNHEGIVENLIRYRARINHAGKRARRTALMWAASQGHYEMTRILAENSADLGLTDVDGKRADQLALQQGHKRVAEMLRDRMNERR